MRDPIPKFTRSVPFKVTLVAIICMGIYAVAFIQDRVISFQAGRGPAIRVSENIHPFGETNTWEMLEHTFKVFNDGEGVLRIERVSPD